MRSERRRGCWLFVFLTAAGCSSDIGSGNREPAPIPQPERVSGDLVAGATFTLTGAAFGAKDPAAPWIWDTFEAGAPDSEIQGWNIWYDHQDPLNPPPRYTIEDAASGAQSAALNFEGHQTHNALLKYRDELHDSMFGSIKYKFVKTGGFDSRNIKLFRLMGQMEGDPVHGNPVIAWGGMDSMSGLDPDDPEPWDEYNGWNIALTPGPDCGAPGQMYGESPRDLWHTFSQWIFLSSSDGADDGLYGKRLNNDFDEATGVTKCAGSTSERLDEAAIGLYLAHDRHLDTDEDGDIDDDDDWVFVQSDYVIYIDDVYIDITLQRVEICDQPVWEEGNCEVQIPHTNWEDDSIELTAHQGNLPSGETLHLFVINEDGVAGDPIEVRFE